MRISICRKRNGNFGNCFWRSSHLWGFPGNFCKNAIRKYPENLQSTFPSIEAGKKANLTLFLPNEEFVFEETDIISKSKNNAFVNNKLKGKVIGIFNKDRLFLNK